MSVEDAREELLAAGWAWHGDQDKVEPKIDRLILEVQAEMPCYPQSVIGQRVPNCYDDAVSGGPPAPLCPSCTARMKLKEAADAR